MDKRTPKSNQYEVGFLPVDEREKTTERAIASIFSTSQLAYYRDILPPKKIVKVTLTRDEMAAILQAYDYGVDNCDSEGKQHLEQAINSLKDKIHP